MSVQAILYEKGTDVVTVPHEAGIDDAAELMREHRIGALPVTNGSKVVGMISLRDIVEGFSRHRNASAALRVADLMQRNFVRISPQESIKRVMALMTQYRATHIPVFAADRLAGIVSIGDVVKHRLEDLELETNVLRDAYIAAH
jgi:CBS domain-containing protein